MSKNSNILTTFIAGAAVGAVLGILFAPDKGSETRKKVSEEGKKMSDALKNRFNGMKEKMNAVKNDLEQQEDIA